MKNKVVILVIMSLIFILGNLGCGFMNKNEIEIKEIFSQKEDEYYIYFYKDDCPYCDMVTEEIKLLEQGNIKVYKINLSKKNNQLIGRGYENGQGSNGKFYVDGISKYDELYISIAPAIIKISRNKESLDKEASYIAGGSREIIEMFSTD